MVEKVSKLKSAVLLTMVSCGPPSKANNMECAGAKWMPSRPPVWTVKFPAFEPRSKLPPMWKPFMEVPFVVALYAPPAEKLKFPLVVGIPRNTWMPERSFKGIQPVIEVAPPAPPKLATPRP